MKFYTLPGEQHIPALGFGYRLTVGPGSPDTPQRALERRDPLYRTIGYD